MIKTIKKYIEYIKFAKQIDNNPIVASLIKQQLLFMRQMNDKNYTDRMIKIQSNLKINRENIARTQLRAQALSEEIRAMSESD